jgi:hypothetical protein
MKRQNHRLEAKAKIRKALQREIGNSRENDV